MGSEARPVRQALIAWSTGISPPSLIPIKVGFSVPSVWLHEAVKRSISRAARSLRGPKRRPVDTSRQARSLLRQGRCCFTRLICSGAVLLLKCMLVRVLCLEFNVAVA